MRGVISHLILTAGILGWSTYRGGLVGERSPQHVKAIAHLRRLRTDVSATPLSILRDSRPLAKGTHTSIYMMDRDLSKPPSFPRSLPSSSIGLKPRFWSDRGLTAVRTELIAAENNSGDMSSSSSASDAPKKKKSIGKRIVTGWLLALTGTLVIFSGNVLYTSVLVLVAMMAQQEYFNTVMMTGVNPARRISFVASLAMYVCACTFPLQHQLGLPLGFAAVVMWFLVMRPKPGSIADISTTVMGLVYTGLLPSYWARLRCIQDGIHVSPHLAATLDQGFRWLSPLPVASDVVTAGAITYWFTATSCALSDVGAYFGGRKWGKTKISEVCPAAGGASPNKTVEGFLSGSVLAIVTALIGAKIMSWPHWWFSGFMYGILISVINLLGDLMASMIKRDAGVKDFGNCFPGHGGVLDRLDSYIFVGPSAYAFVTLFLPLVAKIGVAPMAAGVLGVVGSIAVMCDISRRDFWQDMRHHAIFNRNGNAGEEGSSGVSMSKLSSS